MYIKDGVKYELIAHNKDWLLRPIDESERLNAYGEAIGHLFLGEQFSCIQAVECFIRHFMRRFVRIQ